MFPARAARALPSTVELTVNLFKDSVTSDVMEEAVVGGEEMDSWSDAFKDWTDSGIGEVTVGGSAGGRVFDKSSGWGVGRGLRGVQGRDDFDLL